MSLVPAVRPSKARDAAWGWLLSNLVVVPGLGSILGRRKVGYLQSALAIGGMILTLTFAVSVIREWWVLRELPPLDRRWLVQGLGGIFLFSLGWLWGLFTGLSLLKEAGKADGASADLPDEPDCGG